MILRTLTLSLAAFVASASFASNASATTANFKYKVCFIKASFREEGEGKVKEKDKYKKVVVEGLDSLQMTYRFSDDFDIVLATQVVNDRKRNVISDVGADGPALAALQLMYEFPGNFTVNTVSLEGRRKVNKSFKKSVDWFDLRANITYDDGDFEGLTFDVRYDFSCKAKGKRQ